MHGESEYTSLLFGFSVPMFWGFLALIAVLMVALILYLKYVDKGEDEDADIMHQVIRKKVERYFQTDPGREAIKSAVDRAMPELMSKIIDE